MRIKLIFISMASHFASLCERGLGHPPPIGSQWGGGEGVESGAPFSNNTPTGAHAPF